jgi:addiction module RelE/StbE family toxin
MNYKVEWTLRALAKFDEIFDYIASESKTNAKSLALEILEQEENLKTIPKLGRQVPYQDDPSFREIIIGNYSLFYFVFGDEIQIRSLYRSSELFSYNNIKLK